MTDTTDLRSGPPISDALLAVLALVGEWEGVGQGVVASSGAQFDYRQQLTFAHDGRPFLVYQSQSWLIDAGGSVIRPAFRESGFLRANGDDVELMVADAAGLTELFVGVAGDNRWELITSAVAASPTARTVIAERRFYAVVGDTLRYATELDTGPGLAPHLNAGLTRR